MGSDDQERAFRIIEVVMYPILYLFIAIDCCLYLPFMCFSLPFLVVSRFDSLTGLTEQ